jgi:hypothetical protein
MLWKSKEFVTTKLDGEVTLYIYILVECTGK